MAKIKKKRTIMLFAGLLVMMIVVGYLIILMANAKTEENLVFFISGFVAGEELLRIAESVRAVS